MRQYASRSESGTMMQSQRAPEPLDNVIDRVMQIAERVVRAEMYSKNQDKKIEELTKKVEALTEQNEKLVIRLDNIALKASGKEFKKPETTTRTRKTTTKTTES